MQGYLATIKHYCLHYYYNYYYYKQDPIQWQKCFHLWNWQTNSCSRPDFLKVDQHAGGKWLIHRTELHNSLFQEIAILEFPTSDCFQNEAICDNKLTAAAGPVGNTWWRPERRNKLLVLATGPCWIKNYNCPIIWITGRNRLKQMFTGLISSPSMML